MSKRGIVAALLLVGTAPAQASEIFGGLLVHDVNTPLSEGGFEDGVDIQLGWRGDRLRALHFLGAPSPYVFGSLAIGAKTHFAAAGLSWRIGSGPFFARPGAGIALQTRPRHLVDDAGFRRDLGSRIVFEPEIDLGYRITDRIAIEASWVHLSHARLFSHQNPGMESIGLRLTLGLR